MVEAEFRQLVRSAQLDQPDDVEFTCESVVFRWHGPKVQVVLDLDEPGVDAQSERAGTKDER